MTNHANFAPTEDRKALFESVHGGLSGGHLRYEKMHDQLVKVARHEG